MLAVRSLVLVFVLGLQSLSGQTWTQVSAQGPSGRLWHGMAFDSSRNVTALFGGADAAGYCGDLWEWDGSVWTQRNPGVAPPARQFPGLAYDSQRQVVVMYGGNASSTVFDDTWEFDGTNWQQRSPTVSPGMRSEHAMAYDSWRGRTVMFGGNSPTGLLGDTWEWDGNSWTQRQVSGPPGRLGSSMAFDSRLGATVLFGGFPWPNPAVGNDTWQWGGNTWTQVNPAHVPPVRWYASMAFDSGLNRSVLFAGNSVPSFLNDTWTFDGTDWTQMVLPASPSTRMRPALAFDGSRGRTVMFGGYSDNGFESDTWEMDSGGGSGPHMYPAGATMFGVGCGSQALTVSPTQGSRPLLGQSQLTDVTNIPTFYAAMALGFSSTSIGSLTLPLALDLFGMPGCYLYHDISIDLAEFCSPTGSGQGRHTLPIPANNALLGVVLYLQAWSGTNQNAGGLVTSNAIELTIGNQ